MQHKIIEKKIASAFTIMNDISLKFKKELKKVSLIL